MFFPSSFPLPLSFSASQRTSHPSPAAAAPRPSRAQPNPTALHPILLPLLQTVFATTCGSSSSFLSFHPIASKSQTPKAAAANRGCDKGRTDGGRNREWGQTGLASSLPHHALFPPRPRLVCSFGLWLCASYVKLPCLALLLLPPPQPASSSPVPTSVTPASTLKCAARRGKKRICTRSLCVKFLPSPMHARLPIVDLSLLKISCKNF